MAEIREIELPGNRTFEIIKSNTIAVPTDNLSAGGAGWYIGSVSNHIHHDLGFVPAVLAFLDPLGDGSSYQSIPRVDLRLDIAGCPMWETTRISSTDSILTVTVEAMAYLTAGVGYTYGGMNVKYYLLKEVIK